MKRNNRKRPALQHKRQRGFTLLEIMIVLIIIVMIAGLGITAVFQRLEVANRKTARAYITQLANAVDMFELDVKRPPTTEEGLAALVNQPAGLESWQGPYITDAATSRDPWGGEYQYTSPGRNGTRYEIWSFGRDGMDGTDDDIGSWMSVSNF